MATFRDKSLMCFLPMLLHNRRGHLCLCSGCGEDLHLKHKHENTEKQILYIMSVNVNHLIVRKYLAL